MFIVGKKYIKGAIYCGRGTVYGNPFIMKDKSIEERNRVCDEYQKRFEIRVKTDIKLIKGLNDLLERHALEGEVILGCFCAPKRCHLDTIAKYLNDYLDNPETHEFTKILKGLN